jgi:hypothetical protein
VHLATLPRDAAAYGRHHTDLPSAEPLDLAAYPVPRPLGPTPRTIREHVGAREFGRFASALRTPAERTSDLTATVGRLRSRGPSIGPQVGVRLIAMRDAAQQRAGRAANMAMLAVAAAIVVWISIPVALATIAGQL